MTRPFSFERRVMTISIALPLTTKQAVAVVVAADRLGVEPWEIAVHVLALRADLGRSKS
jgi:hypothetical protein